MGANNHDETAKRLTHFVHISNVKNPTTERCSSPEVQQCDKCVACVECLHDQTLPICQEQQCQSCGSCAEYPLCLALEKDCATDAELDAKMGQCSWPEQATKRVPENCKELQSILKCVSEAVGEAPEKAERA